MKLIRISFNKRENGHWESRQLDFGDFVTNIHGPNTSGKTPIIKSLMMCLGMKIQLPTELVNSFESVSLEINMNNKRLQLTRALKEEMQISILDLDNSEEKKITSFDDFSEELFLELDMPRNQLTKKGNTESSLAYADTLFSLLFADQDFGWAEIYSYDKYTDFIKSQPQEMIRLILGLKAKYPFRNKNAYDTEKVRSKANKMAIQLKKELIKQLGMKGSKYTNDKLNKLKNQKAKHESKIDQIAENLNLISDGDALYDDSVAEEERGLNDLTTQLIILESKKERLILEMADLESEIDILEDNEEVNSALRLFCGNPNCAIFKTESFGKRLLYLKDQNKDLQMVLDSVNKEVESLKEKQEEHQKSLSVLVKSSGESQSLKHKKLLVLSKETVQKLVKVERKLVEAEEYSKLNSQLNALIQKKESIEENLELLKPARAKTNQIDVSSLDNFSSIISDWLNSVSYSHKKVTVDKNLDLYIDDKIFNAESDQSGSWRHRVILAYYASVLEFSLASNGNHPGFIVLDGIRQHEMNMDDIYSYLNKFKKLKTKYNKNIQILFSISEEEFSADYLDDVVTWYPQYINNERGWYFGESREKLNDYEVFVISNFLSKYLVSENESDVLNLKDILGMEFSFKKDFNHKNVIDCVESISNAWVRKKSM